MEDDEAAGRVAERVGVSSRIAIKFIYRELVKGMERMEEELWMMCQLCRAMSRRDSVQWLQPCPCPQPYHRQCLQYRVWDCEAQGKAPSCPWCGALYRVEPSRGALDRFARCWLPLLRKTVGVVVRQVAVDSVFTTFGLIMLSRVYGVDEAWVLLGDLGPMSAVVLCYALPFAAITINHIPWEEYCLKTLRRCSSLPLLGTIMPQEGPQLQATRRRSINSCGAIVGGLLLPIFAKLTGHLLFHTEKSSVKRFLFGGAVFLVVRGVLFMYYRQKTFVRQNHLTVANYATPSNRPNESSDAPIGHP